jgi:hypothetical protein
MSSNLKDTDGEWQELTTVSTDAEARLVAGWLESEGIECQIESLVFTQEPVQFGLLGGVRVHVLDGELERARGLLERLQTDARDLEGEELADEDAPDEDTADEDAPT